MAKWSETGETKSGPKSAGVYVFMMVYRGGPHMRSLISIDFPAPEMEPESAHVVSAVSVP